MEDVVTGSALAQHRLDKRPHEFERVDDERGRALCGVDTSPLLGLPLNDFYRRGGTLRVMSVGRAVGWGIQGAFSPSSVRAGRNPPPRVGWPRQWPLGEAEPGIRSLFTGSLSGVNMELSAPSSLTSSLLMVVKPAIAV
jgi:hypothetical protein